MPVGIQITCCFCVVFLFFSENCSHLKSLEITLKQGDHSAEVKDGITVPDYPELVEGYQVGVRINAYILCNISNSKNIKAPATYYL